MTFLTVVIVLYVYPFCCQILNTRIAETANF